MSNKSIIKRIEESINDFKKEKIDIKSLKESFQSNSAALEMMPYNMIKEVSDIEYNLTVSQFSDEEGCHSNIEEVVKQIETWVNKVPIENT